VTAVNRDGIALARVKQKRRRKNAEMKLKMKKPERTSFSGG